VPISQWPVIFSTKRGFPWIISERAMKDLKDEMPIVSLSFYYLHCFPAFNVLYNNNLLTKEAFSF